MRANERASDPSWMYYAWREYGEHEISGAEDNPRIQEYRRYSLEQVVHDEVPWCSDFMNWVLREAGYQITKSSRARSWAEMVHNVVRRLDEPQYGAITVFWRGDFHGWQGHVAFYLGDVRDNIAVLGGNQNNQVGVNLYPKRRLLGYYWPLAVNE